VGAGAHLWAGERLFGKVGKHGLEGGLERGHGGGDAAERAGVDEAAAGLVEGVGREGVVVVEAREQCWLEAGDELLDLALGGGVSGNGVGAGEGRKVLAEGVAGDVAVEETVRIEERGVGVPAAHVLAGSRETGAFAEGLEEHVVVESEEEAVILDELLLCGTRKESDGGVIELG